MQNLKWQQWSRIEGVRERPYPHRRRRSLVSKTRLWLRLRDLQKKHHIPKDDQKAA